MYLSNLKNVYQECTLIGTMYTYWDKGSYFENIQMSINVRHGIQINHIFREEKYLIYSKYPYWDNIHYYEQCMYTYWDKLSYFGDYQKKRYFIISRYIWALQ